MKRLRALGPCLLVVCACAIAVAAPSASAEEPFYEINHVRLTAGKTTELVFTKTLSPYVFKLPGGITVTCTTVVLKAGATLNGSEKGIPGTNKEVIEFSKCAQTGNGVLCTVEGEGFKTTALLSTLVTSAAKKFLYIRFKPEVATLFALIKFSGVCTRATVEIIGSTACEYLIGGTVVEVGKEPEESVKPEFNFPAAQIKEVWTEGATVQVGLTVGGEPASTEGKSETKVTKEEPWGVYDK